MIDRIFHVVASTRDQVASLKFYEDTLGMTIIHRPCVAREGMSEAFAPSQTSRDTQDLGTFYKCSDTETATVLDTNLWMRPRFVGSAYEAVNHTGITRLALKVGGIDALHASLSERGCDLSVHRQRSRLVTRRCAAPYLYKTLTMRFFSSSTPRTRGTPSPRSSASSPSVFR